MRIFVAAVCWASLGAALRSWRCRPAAEGLGYPGSTDLLLVSGGYAAAAQVGILVLTVFTLFLLIETDFTRHAGEFVAVVLMAATGGLLIAAAQDLLVIFVGLELLSLGLYILTAFAKQSGKSAEGAMKYYLFGGMSAAFLLFGFSYLYGIGRLDESAPDHARDVWPECCQCDAAALCCAGDDCGRAWDSKWRPCRFICGLRIHTRARLPLPRRLLLRYQRSRALHC